jgi:hypothetical protein
MACTLGPAARISRSECWGIEGAATAAKSARMNLNWRRPLVYLLAPILVFLCFIGFPPPFAPPRSTRAAQEQSVPAEEHKAEK